MFTTRLYRWRCNRDPWRRVLHCGPAAIGAAAAAIVEVAVGLGYVTESKEAQGGGLRITARRDRSELGSVLRAMPREMVWWLERRGEETRVATEFRPSRAATAMVAGLALLALGAVGVSMVLYERASPAVQAQIGPPLALCFLAGLALGWWVVTLLGAWGGGRQVAGLWQPVLASLADREERLELLGSTVSPLYSCAVLGFTVLFLGLVSWPMWVGWSSLLVTTTAVERWTFAAVLGMLALIATAAVAIYRRSPFMVRADALLSGLAGSGAVLFLLAVPLPLLVTGGDLEVALRAAPRLADELQTWAASGLLLAGVVGVIGLVLAGKGLLLTLDTWLPVARLHRAHRSGVDRQAVSDPTALWRFRRLFLPLWLVSGILLFALLGHGLLSALETLAPRLSPLGVRAVERSATTLVLALGRPPEEAWSLSVARVGWALYGLGAMALSALSLGQLARQRRRERRELTASAATQEATCDPLWERWQAVVDRLCRTAGLGPVCLLFDSGSDYGAQAHRVGLLHPKRFVEVSRRCLEELEPEEVEALLAHELAHHLLGHCRRVNLLRWLGRASFVGDAFALTIQATAWYEHAADAVAVGERFGVARPELLGAIVKLHHLGSAGGLEADADPRGLRAVPASLEKRVNLPAGGPAALPWHERWPLAWEVFRLQYFEAMETHYWHPEKVERKAELGRS